MQPSAAQRATTPTNVLVVGVGGQGVIMVSRVVASLCHARGLQVKQSEVHGMAKRGGAVFSHIRFGHQVWSPTIPKGEADVLIALEWAEGLRWLDYLDPHRGILIADTQRIVPPFSCRNRKRGAVAAYVTETPAEIIDRVAQGFALDAGGIAGALGNRRAANTVLLGALSCALDFAADDWLEVLSRFVPAKTVEINRRAFLEGRAWVAEADAGAERQAVGAGDAPPAAPAAEAHRGVRLEIIEAWCKGCDICVKMCPERCLLLNGKGIVELTDAGACTGCRICEWLCPDFAIAVHADGAAAAIAR
jgi:indolepyruvate ferredoxin oxidoreductase beta subunit